MIGDDAAVVQRFVKQRSGRRDFRAAEQPRFELPGWWRRLIGIGGKGEPCLLPFAGRPWGSTHRMWQRATNPPTLWGDGPTVSRMHCSRR